MPINRSYMTGIAQSHPELFQALRALADHADAMEKAIGVTINNGVGVAAIKPKSATLAAAVANGTIAVELTNPSASGSTPIQHQVQLSTSPAFTNAKTLTLGLGQTTQQVVAPSSNTYIRFRSRYQGGDYNEWTPYTTNQGVTALQTGPLV